MSAPSDLQRQESYRQTLDDFERELEACKVKAICGRTFLRIKRLAKWLKKNTGTLLWAAYSQENRSSLPINERQVQNSTFGDGPILVFGVLLELKYGHFIDLFHSVRLAHRLPHSLYDLETALKAGGDPRLTEEDAIELARRFDNAQWRYCPPSFDWLHVQKHLPQHIIPIIRKEAINSKGGTAKVYQIAVLEDYVGKEMAELISFSKYQSEGDGLGQVSCVQASLSSDDVKSPGKY